MDLHAHAPGVRPFDVIACLRRVILEWIEQKLDPFDARRSEAIEMSFAHTCNHQRGAGIKLHAAPAHPSRRRRRDNGQRSYELWRKILIIDTRNMQLAGRDHARGSAVKIVANPADRILRWRPFAEHRMDVAVDKPRHHRTACSVE